MKDTILNSLVVRKAQDTATELRSKAQVEYVDADIKKQVEEQKLKKEQDATAGRGLKKRPRTCRRRSGAAKQ